MSKTINGLILAIVICAEPGVALAQETVALLVDPPSVTAVSRCGARQGPYEAAWQVILGAPGMDVAAAKATLLELEGRLEGELASRPGDVELRYALAAAIGTRAEYESGRGQVRAARAAYAQAMGVLELEPDHPGAKYVVGRLHHEVLAMSRIKRFLATRVLGAKELQGASWETARALLEAAVVGDPCRADHHYALARLYLDRGEEELASERLRQVARLQGSTVRDVVVIERARLLLYELAPAG